MAAAEAARVAQRCDEAKESCQLDLSECGLRLVPHCLYLLMKDTKLNACDFSQNNLKSLPAKIGEQFTEMTGLILHHNKLSSLPDALSCCSDLRHLDVSHNNLQFIPDVVYSLHNLHSVNLSHNHITDVDLARLQNLQNLKQLNISSNPLSDTTKETLVNLRNEDFNVIV